MQAGALQQARAFLVMLQQAAQAAPAAAANNSTSSSISQLQLATLFVASRLQTVSKANGSHEHAGSSSGSGADKELQEAYAALLLQALLQQQVPPRFDCGASAEGIASGYSGCFCTQA